jgi:hypothetical protein
MREVKDKQTPKMFDASTKVSLALPFENLKLKTLGSRHRNRLEMDPLDLDKL